MKGPHGPEKTCLLDPHDGPISYCSRKSKITNNYRNRYDCVFFSNPSNTRAVRVPQIILFATRGTTPGLKRTDAQHLLIQAVRFLPVILESLSDVFEEEIF